MADDLGGDALADLALGLGVDRQREIRMRLDVDEARRHGEPCGVDGLLGAAFELRADRGDTAVFNGEISRGAGRAAAVENKPAADQDVMHGKMARGWDRPKVDVDLDIYRIAGRDGTAIGPNAKSEWLLSGTPPDPKGGAAFERDLEGVVRFLGQKAAIGQTLGPIRVRLDRVVLRQVRQLAQIPLV